MTKTRMKISLSMRKSFGALVHPVVYDDLIVCLVLALVYFDVDDLCYLWSEVFLMNKMTRKTTVSVSGNN